MSAPPSQPNLTVGWGSDSPQSTCMIFMTVTPIPNGLIHNVPKSPVEWNRKREKQKGSPAAFSTPERLVEFRQPELTPAQGAARQVAGHTLLQS